MAHHKLIERQRARTYYQDKICGNFMEEIKKVYRMVEEGIPKRWDTTRQSSQPDGSCSKSYH